MTGNFRSVTITGCEWKNGVNNHYPKTFTSLSEASACINWDAFVNGKVRFTVETSTWDTYEWKAFKDDSLLDLELHMRQFLQWVIDGKSPFYKEEDKKNAREWLEIIA